MTIIYKLFMFIDFYFFIDFFTCASNFYKSATVAKLVSVAQNKTIMHYFLLQRLFDISLDLK